MNIYHLARRGTIRHEENAALVLIAPNEHDARQRAAALCGAEGEDPWWNDVDVQILGTATTGIDAHSFACIDCLEA